MSDRNSETFNTWNKLAELYQDKFMNLDLYDHTYNLFCDLITTNQANILDIGCGPGNVTMYLLSKRTDFNILGIDIAPNMIELAAKNNPTAQFAVMDCRHIKSLNNRYDGIIAGFCLPYLSPDESLDLIANAHNLLNEKGVIYISFVEGDPNMSDFKTSGHGRVYFQYHDLDVVTQQLSQTGFDEIKTFTVKYTRSEVEGEMHTIIIAKRKTFLD